MTIDDIMQRHPAGHVNMSEQGVAFWKDRLQASEVAFALEHSSLEQALRDGGRELGFEYHAHSTGFAQGWYAVFCRK